MIAPIWTDCRIEGENFHTTLRVDPTKWQRRIEISIHCNCSPKCIERGVTTIEIDPSQVDDIIAELQRAKAYKHSNVSTAAGVSS
jgi:hypothetical protein